MIPPLVRVGAPTPKAFGDASRYLILFSRGWEIARYMPDGVTFVILDSAYAAGYPNYISALEVTCWLPQDGS